MFFPAEELLFLFGGSNSHEVHVHRCGPVLARDRSVKRKKSTRRGESGGTEWPSLCVNLALSLLAHRLEDANG